jgi:hypothetical protein
MPSHTSRFDKTLLSIYGAANGIYNTTVESLGADLRKLASVQATGFFVRHTYIFADASLTLAEDNQLLPAVALMRTAIEAQARSNHLISFKGEERENKAAELFRLFELSRNYYKGLMVKSGLAVPIDWTKVPNCPTETAELITKSFAEFDRAKFDALRKEYESLSREWSYEKVIGRKSFGDPKWDFRTQVQILQQTLELSYVLGSFAVHPDLMSHPTEKMISVGEIMRDATVVAVSAVYCYLVAVGKQDDPRFKRLIADYGDYVNISIKEPN